MLSLTLRFWRSSAGVTAIEFAILAPVLFYFVFAAFEVGMIYTQRELLDRAVTNATKQIYIGAASSGQVTKSDLEKAICDDLIFAGAECRKNLTLRVTPITSLRSDPQTDIICRDSGTTPDPAIGYNPGVRDQFMFMRVCFMKKLLLPGIGFALSLPSASNGRIALVSSSAFVNEPF
ncbi:TadE/TadG family type IV pilus assembly protein [Pseudovibrio sp. Ad26]|uniref:TadE/TadG family type IV pilus assembly protein n=1 Tax=Pseudovibrio sp. Ad26 TaxID=989410 RepID=UPI0007AEA284|nr:TadE/TadG family type IV pilus assembly protein [Pseudovibrio sp. Ad26]KZL07833.1 TadE-like protein [Pseudovibrio sp. Ad26]